MDVDWDAPVSDNGGAVTHYVVEWRLLGAATWTTLDPDPTATSATVSGLTNGELYEFRVAAVNENGTGSFSAVLDGGPATVPGSIDEVTVTEGDEELVFAWPEPSFDGGAFITGYQITADFAADCEPEHWHPDSDGDHRHWWRCTIDDLDNGHEYTFDVAAVNSQGAGDATEATGIPYGAPLAPAVSIADEGDQSMTVTWTEANGNGRDVTGYEIHIDGNLMLTTPPSDPTTLDIGDLANGNTYTVGVRGVNVAGAGTLGEAQGTPYTVPDAPMVSADGEDGVATVTWTEPFDGVAPSPPI